MELFGIFFAAFLINNILLIRFLALCSFFGVSTKLSTSVGMSSAVIFVMTISSAVSWVIYPDDCLVGAIGRVVFEKNAAGALSGDGDLSPPDYDQLCNFGGCFFGH